MNDYISHKKMHTVWAKDIPWDELTPAQQELPERGKISLHKADLTNSGKKRQLIALQVIDPGAKLAVGGYDNTSDKRPAYSINYDGTDFSGIYHGPVNNDGYRDLVVRFDNGRAVILYGTRPGDTPSSMNMGVFKFAKEPEEKSESELTLDKVIRGKMQHMHLIDGTPTLRTKVTGDFNNDQVEDSAMTAIAFRKLKKTDGTPIKDDEGKVQIVPEKFYVCSFDGRSKESGCRDYQIPAGYRLSGNAYFGILNGKISPADVAIELLDANDSKSYLFFEGKSEK